MAAKTDSPQKATRKKLRAAYNRGYLARKRGEQVRVPAQIGKLASDKQQQKVEVVLNYGDLSISIRTDK